MSETKTKTTTTSFKASMCSIVTNLEFLTKEDIQEALNKLFIKGVLKSYCYILHDKDIYTKEEEEKDPKHKEGTAKAHHWHIFIQFKGDVRFSTIAKIFNIPDNMVEKVKASSYKQAVTYCIHKYQPEKYQYDPHEVITDANFDYVKFIESTQRKQTSEERLNEIIELIDNGTIKEYNYTEYLSMKEYTLYNSKIEKAFKYRIDRLSKQQFTKKVIYVHGEAGVGKTFFAKEWCEKNNFSFSITAAGKNPLDDYKGQDVLILDDLRNEHFNFADLLKLLDNHTASPAAARYHNKLLEAKFIIITSSKTLIEFYESTLNHDDEAFTQLKRRITTLIKATRKDLSFYSYNKSLDSYRLAFIQKNECKYKDKEIVDNTIDLFRNMYSYDNPGMVLDYDEDLDEPVWYSFDVETSTYKIDGEAS